MRVGLIAVFAVFSMFTLWPQETVASDQSFWTPPASARSCDRGNAVIPLATERQVFGWKPRNSGVKFVEDLSRNISRGIGNSGYNAKGLALQLVKAAESGAFTRPRFEGSGRPSPIFLTSSILITLSYAVDFLDSRNAWTVGQRNAVIAWGNTLDKNQNKQQSPSRDSVAAFAAARMAWGTATDQSSVFNNGLRSFKRTGRLLTREGYFERNPRDNNEVVGLMVLAAVAARGFGQDVAALSFKGTTLHDAVAAHSENTIRIGPKEITEGDTGHTGSYLKPNGYASHLAWIPVYLSQYPRTPASASVRRLEKTMRLYSRNAYNGTSLGGYTGCLWK